MQIDAQQKHETLDSDGPMSMPDRMNVDLQIREATESDLPAIVDIYNESIPAGWSTADTKPVTVSERVEWFRRSDSAKRPIWVAEADGLVVATVYLSSFYEGRPAYDATAEVSIYVATDYQRRGIGRRLKEWVIDQCPRLGVTTLLSMHFDHNQATRHINATLGFQQMGQRAAKDGGNAEKGGGDERRNGLTRRSSPDGVRLHQSSGGRGHRFESCRAY